MYDYVSVLYVVSFWKDSESFYEVGNDGIFLVIECPLPLGILYGKKILWKVSALGHTCASQLIAG